MINKIEGFFPDTTPTVYDKEEFTVLRLAAKLNGKVNEIIDYINGVSPGPTPGPTPETSSGFHTIIGKNEGVQDTAAVQAAMDLYAATKTILLSGYFKIQSTLIVPNNTHLLFTPGSVMEFIADSNGMQASDAPVKYNITIEKGHFKGLLTGDVQFLFRFEEVSNVRITDCIIENFAKGLRLVSCRNFIIRGCYVNNCGFTTTANDRNSIIITGQTAQGLIEKNVVTNSGSYGINWLSNDDVNILHNYVWNCGKTGIVAAGGAKHRVIVQGNNCCYNGTSFTPAAEAAINFHGLTHGLISDNICCYNVNYGLDINGSADGEPENRAQDLLITNNICLENGNIGIYAFNLIRCIISHNICKKNYIGIQVSGGDCDTITIINNQCYDSTSSGIKILYGTNIIVDNNSVGSVDPTIDNYGIYFENTITNMIMGWNDFSKMVKYKNGFVYNSLDRTKIRFKNVQTWVSDVFDLSAATASSPIPLRLELPHSMIWRAYIVYTEATSADVGCIVGIGDGTSGAGKIFWGGVTTESSKGVGVRTEFTMTKGRTDYGPQYIPYFYCEGGKIGTGAGRIVVEYIPRHPLYD